MYYIVQITPNSVNIIDYSEVERENQMNNNNNNEIRYKRVCTWTTTDHEKKR